MNIGQKVKELRKEKKLTQKQLAELLEMSEQSIFKIESGINIPNFSTIAKLITVLEVSANELFGTYDVGMKFDYETSIASNIVNMREERGLMQHELADYSGVDINVIREIESGKLLPSDDVLNRIANALRVSNEAIKKPDNFERNILEKELMVLIEKRKSFLELYKKTRGYHENKKMLIDEINLNNMPLIELKKIYDFICQEKILKLSSTRRKIHYFW